MESFPQLDKTTWYGFGKNKDRTPLTAIPYFALRYSLQEGCLKTPGTHCQPLRYDFPFYWRLSSPKSGRDILCFPK